MITADVYTKKLIVLMKDFIQDWDCDFEGELGADTKLFADIGFESIDIIQLIIAIQEDILHSDASFEKLLMKDGRYVDDLSIGQIADYMAQLTRAA